MVTTTTTTTVEGLPSQMTACQVVEFHKPHQVRKIEVPTTVRPHEIMLKVAVAGLCHSDLEYLKGTFAIKLPVTGSHEGTGVVVGVGRDVTNFKVGDRVLAGQTFGRCGECDVCRGPEKFRHYCPHRETMMNVERNGAFQEYLVVDAREACHIPDEMSFATAAPLACAGCTSYRAVNLVDVKPGDWMGIVGSGGGLGHLAIQFAKAKGLKVIAVDARDEGLALSREFGADVVIDIRDGIEQASKKAKEVTGDSLTGGAAVSLILSDHKTAAKTACAITRNHGYCVQVAILDPVETSFADLIFRDIHLIGSFMASQAETQQMLYDIVEHKIKVENNVFHGLEEIPRAVEMLRNGQYRGKACIVVDEDEFEKDQENKRV